MSDKGDKICPLCTEEMDLTDQQLKPCKCGYEICVWCWNHIMEMAEKDSTEGRCPACRMPYDKEKIVGAAADCERLVAEINSERKLKSQKLKPKTPEGRMHLNNVRVIQRNLVYVIGLPLNLADEALLQRREYFGQYGKVLKVSISRTATGVIQHSSNNSCCVYITYSKEEEAVRCIQSVHSFVLEGRSLRACFGTTKYCHAWLKNMPCSIPDCLYLHNFGSEEDSFTKDDLVSAFTRSRVQQSIGATNNLHRRSGNVLPPPADDFTNGDISSTVKPNSKNSSNNIGILDSGSCTDDGTGRSSGAASWVMRVSASLLPVTSSVGSGGTVNHKPETSKGPQLSASEVAFQDIAVLPSATRSLKLTKTSCDPGLHEDEHLHAHEDLQGLCSGLSSISIGSHLEDEYDDPVVPESWIANSNLSGSQGSQQDVWDLLTEPSALPALSEHMIVEDLQGFADQQPKGLRGAPHQPSVSYSAPEQNWKPSSYASWQQSEVNHQRTVDAHPTIVPVKNDEVAFPLPSSNPILTNGSHSDQAINFSELGGTPSHSSILSDVGFRKYMEEHDNNVDGTENKVAPDTGESSIIANILSMDLDEREDLLTLPTGLLNLLNETDKRCSLKMPSLRKVQDISQSKFSFARQDDFFGQVSNLEHSLENETRKFSDSHDFVENNDHDVSSKTSSREYDGFLRGPSLMSYKFSVSNAPASPPPGFPVLSRAVRPGFPMHGTGSYDHSVNRSLQNSVPPLRNVWSSRDVEFVDPAIMEVGKGIQAARLNNPGFDSRSALSMQFSPFDHDVELQMLVRQSMPAQQNPNFPDHFRNRFSPPNDAYSISPMLLGQSPPHAPSVFPQVAAQQLRNSHMSNGHLGVWNDVRSNSDLGTSEMRTNGGLGFNKFIPSYEDFKYQMSTSSNIYNRGFAL